MFAFIIDMSNYPYCNKLLENQGSVNYVQRRFLHSIVYQNVWCKRIETEFYKNVGQTSTKNAKQFTRMLGLYCLT